MYQEFVCPCGSSCLELPKAISLGYVVQPFLGLDPEIVRTAVQLKIRSQCTHRLKYHSLQKHYTHETTMFKWFSGLHYSFAGGLWISFYYSYIFPSSSNRIQLQEIIPLSDFSNFWQLHLHLFMFLGSKTQWIWIEWYISFNRVWATQ